MSLFKLKMKYNSLKNIFFISAFLLLFANANASSIAFNNKFKLRECHFSKSFL